MEEKAKKPPPQCKAILLCDQVIHDIRTRKTSLIGLVNFFALRRLPGRSRPFSIFLQMVEGIGEYLMTSEIRSLRDDSIIARLPPLNVRFPQRTSQVNVDLGNLSIQFPYEGPFDLVVYADGEEIDRRRFEAKLFKGPMHPPLGEMQPPHE